MNRKPLVPLALASALLAAMPAVAQTTAYALLTADQGLSFVIDSAAQNPAPVLPILGLAEDDVLVAIDVRPQTGRLYGLAHNPKLGTVNLYHLDTFGSTVRATSVGAAGSFVDASGAPLPIFAQSFDIDFNPTVDRLRVVASNGLNFRMNPNNGALIDGNFNNTVTPPAGVNPDANLNGGAGGTMATAYTNNVINTTITTQYALDHNNDTLYIQNPPNAGTLVSPLAVTSAGVPLNFAAAGGLDIEPGINATASGMPGAGRAVAALTVAGQSRLYRLNLADGVATLLANVGGLNIVDVAVFNLPATVNALSLSGTRFNRFAFATPGTVAQANVTGVVAGERLVGFDMRPSTGQLYALGIDADRDRGTIYILEPQTPGTPTPSAMATPVGAPGRIAYVDTNGVPIDLSDLPVSLDFNPFVDRIRIVDASGLNARANPIDGAPIDSDTNPANGVNPDASVQAEFGTQIVGAAYTSNWASPPFTTQYTLDQTFGRLYVQNPPNSGVQTMLMPLMVGSDPFVLNGDTGFDIPPGPAGTGANLPAFGFGYFTANNLSNAPALYELNLANAMVQSLGPIGGDAPSLTSLSVYNAPIAVGFDVANASVNEGSPATLSILLLQGGSAPVHFSTSNGTAVAGQDYTATQGTVFVRAGNPQAAIQIPILEDSLNEPNETFTVTLNGAFAAPVTLTVTILDRGDPIFSDGFE